MIKEKAESMGLELTSSEIEKLQSVADYFGSLVPNVDAEREVLKLIVPPRQYKLDFTLKRLAPEIVMNIHVSKLLTFRLKAMLVLMRFAAWVGSVGVEVVFDD